MSRAGQAGRPMTVVFKLGYSLGSIPSGTGRLYCQDVARRATNRSRGSEVQDLQPTGAACFSACRAPPVGPGGHGATAVTVSYRTTRRERHFPPIRLTTPPPRPLFYYPPYYPL